MRIPNDTSSTSKMVTYTTPNLSDTVLGLKLSQDRHRLLDTGG